MKNQKISKLIAIFFFALTSSLMAQSGQAIIASDVIKFLSQAIELDVSAEDYYILQQNLVKEQLDSLLQLYNPEAELLGSQFVAIVRDLLQPTDAEEEVPLDKALSFLQKEINVDDFSKFLSTPVSCKQFDKVIRVLVFPKMAQTSKLARATAKIKDASKVSSETKPIVKDKQIKVTKAKSKSVPVKRSKVTPKKIRSKKAKANPSRKTGLLPQVDVNKVAQTKLNSQPQRQDKSSAPIKLNIETSMLDTKEAAQQVESKPKFDKDNEDRAFWGEISVGYMWDTNSNGGLSLPYRIGFNQPAHLANGARKEDHGRLVSLELNYLGRLTRIMSWKTHFRFNVIDYHNDEPTDYRDLYLSSGPVWTFDYGSFSLPFMTDILKYNRDLDFGNYLASSYGILPEFKFHLAGNLSLHARIGYIHQHYRDDGDRNLDIGLWDHFIRLQVNPRSTMDLGFIFEDASARNKAFDYQAREFYGRYAHQLTETLELIAYCAYRQISYEGFEAGYSTSRDDKLFYMSATLSYYMRAVNAYLQFIYAFSNNHSTIDRYEYDRDQFTLLLKKPF